MRGISELECVWSEILRLDDQHLLAYAQETMGRITLLHLSSGGKFIVSFSDFVQIQLLMLAIFN